MSKKLVIHICGSSGSGKTTLGNKLRDKYGDKIKVKDLDNLRNNYLIKFCNNNWNLFNKKEYQKYLDNYIKKQKKILILTGLNHIFWIDKKLYYNIHSNYNYFIKLDDNIIIKQKCLRFINDDLIDMMKIKNIKDDIINDNNKFIKLIKENIDRECGFKFTKKLNKMWNNDYKKQQYIFLSRNEIYNEIIKIINHNF